MRCLLALIAACAAVAACSKPAEPTDTAAAKLRIVSLAPNLTELVYSIGAGELLVGVSAWSDYPPAALELPVVGDAFSIDHERLALLSPDLLLVWEGGTPTHVTDKLRGLGYRVEPIRTKSLADISRALHRLGQITDREDNARDAAMRFNQALDRLRGEFSTTESISVFYQVAARPLYTINSGHYISDLIVLCGGRNVFSDLSELAPAVDVEAVIHRDPEVMLASADAGDDAFAAWQRWPNIPAVALANQYLMPADEIGRATTRVTTAAETMCKALQDARENRAALASAIP